MTSGSLRRPLLISLSIDGFHGAWQASFTSNVPQISFQKFTSVKSPWTLTGSGDLLVFRSQVYTSFIEFWYLSTTVFSNFLDFTRISNKFIEFNSNSNSTILSAPSLRCAVNVISGRQDSWCHVSGIANLRLQPSLVHTDSRLRNPDRPEFVVYFVFHMYLPFTACLPQLENSGCKTIDCTRYAVNVVSGLVSRKYVVLTRLDPSLVYIDSSLSLTRVLVEFGEARAAELTHGMRGCNLNGVKILGVPQRGYFAAISLPSFLCTLRSRANRGIDVSVSDQSLVGLGSRGANFGVA
ncbi:hypothetical protein B0H11DRAFT_2432541 [Mycena galericulata]|nr:hypothetical protein B0H11DRAFT_2432541 [Mycena galericulata]